MTSEANSTLIPVQFTQYVNLSPITSVSLPAFVKTPHGNHYAQNPEVFVKAPLKEVRKGLRGVYFADHVDVYTFERMSRSKNWYSLKMEVHKFLLPNIGLVALIHYPPDPHPKMRLLPFKPIK